MKFAVACVALLAGVNGFSVAPAGRSSTALFNEGKGAGGMFDTRNPDAMEHEDPRKSISAAPSFEEYLKSRGAGGDAAPAEEPVAAAPAAAPVATPEADASGNYGKYDDKLFDNEAKKAIYAEWDPNSPRSPLNFNPFETWDGNSPDASGFYPGERRYKDPARGDVSFQTMMDERKEAEERAANPKPGDAPGCPGCRN